MIITHFLPDLEAVFVKNKTKFELCFNYYLSYVIRCVIWYHSNAYELILRFFYLSVVSMHLYELAWHFNRSVKCETLEYHSNG